MRAKVILSALLLALVLLAPAFYFHFQSGQTNPSPAPAAVENAADSAPVALPTARHHVAGPVMVEDSVPTRADEAADLNSPNHPEYVMERKAELYQLGLSQDPTALPTILTEVHNADPEIRQTALTAVMDFGSTNAIPSLRSEMAWTDDPQEKIQIQKAIKFLELPPFALDENGALTQQPGP